MSVRTIAAMLSMPVLGLGLVACGSEDAPKTEDGAVSSVEDYVDEFNNGDYSEACDHFTDDYVEAVLEDWNDDEDGVGNARTCTAMLQQSALLLRAFVGVEDDEQIYEIDEISAAVDGDEATVDVTYKDDDTSTFGLVYDDGEWLIDEDLEDVADDEVTLEPSAEESESQVAPSSIGETVELGDWRITVTAVEEDADATIAKANQFNEKPDHRYTMFTYEAAYAGDARTAHVGADLTWSFTTGEAEVVETDDQVTPGDNQNWPSEVRTGGTARQQIVFDVEPATLDGGVLSVESYDEDYNEIYIDFTF